MTTDTIKSFVSIETHKFTKSYVDSREVLFIHQTCNDIATFGGLVLWCGSCTLNEHYPFK